MLPLSCALIVFLRCHHLLYLWTTTHVAKLDIANLFNNVCGVSYLINVETAKYVWCFKSEHFSIYFSISAASMSYASLMWFIFLLCSDRDAWNRQCRYYGVLHGSAVDARSSSTARSYSEDIQSHVIAKRLYSEICIANRATTVS